MKSSLPPFTGSLAERLVAFACPLSPTGFTPASYRLMVKSLTEAVDPRAIASEILNRTAQVMDAGGLGDEDTSDCDHCYELVKILTFLHAFRPDDYTRQDLAGAFAALNAIAQTRYGLSEDNDPDVMNEFDAFIAAWEAHWTGDVYKFDLYTEYMAKDLHPRILPPDFADGAQAHAAGIVRQRAAGESLATVSAGDSVAVGVCASDDIPF